MRHQEQEAKMSKSRLLGLLAITMVAGLMVSGCKNPMGLPPDTGTAGGWDDRVVFTLYGGQTIPVGTITVWNTPDMLYIQYDMTGNWWLEETHVSVATKLSSIPQKNGNPPPGQFEFKNTWNPRVQTYRYEIPFRAGWGIDSLYIATHAVAVELDGGGSVIQRQTGWTGPHPFPGRNWATYLRYNFAVLKNVTLPTGTVGATGVYVGDISTTYWRFTLSGVSSEWSGPQNGWCADVSNSSAPTNVTLFSTAIPSALPEDLRNTGWDNVNYLLNNRPTVAALTALDVQWAIWFLLSQPGVPYPDPQNYPQATLVKQMVDDAGALGDGWYPTTGDLMAVILKPTNSQQQICFIEVDP
jgi:hypothetical protein